MLTALTRCKRHKHRSVPLLSLLVLWLAFLAVTSLASANLLGGDEADPLTPQEAFVPSIAKVDASSITIVFDIADGYYLYRDKITVELFDADSAATVTPSNSATSQVLLGAPGFSKAKIKKDDFFGEQAVFRRKATVTVPYTNAKPNSVITLAIRYQGCADIGLCYPPTTSELKVDIPETPDLFDSNGAASLATPVRAASLVTTPLSDLLGTSPKKADLLSPEQAYLPQIVAATSKEIQLQWVIEPGYYLYRDKLSFTLGNAGETLIANVHLDTGTDQHDEFFGNVKVFRNLAKARLVLKPEDQSAGLIDATLQINYQGCADIGVCFPPSVTSLPLVLTQVALSKVSTDHSATKLLAVSGESSNISQTAGPQPREPSQQSQLSEQDRLKTMLGINSLWLNVATFFGLGLLLAFTPCVLPMVPILSSMIVGQGSSMSTSKAFRLSLVYVLVMASTYAVVGIFVGLTGYNVQAFLQNPWVLSGIAILFVALSLSMFGFYELQIPKPLQDRLTQWSNKQGSGQYAGVAAMGFISTLIVGPCVTAPLAGALIYIANTGDALIGGAALFALGLGMGAPLLLIGTSAGGLLPRAGAWMNAMKHVFGLLMLIMAVYMISRFLPTAITMSLYGVLALISAVYFGATDSLTRNSSGWQRFGKGCGLAIGTYGLALIIGALAGGSSYTAPLQGVFSSSGTSSKSNDHGLQFTRLKSLDDLRRVVDQASSEGKPVMLDFYADWCISCKEMEAYTFTDSRVQAKLSNAVLVQADVTANDATDQALLKHFDLFGPPGIIFYDESGEEIPASRLVGYLPADKFSAHLDRFLSRSGS